MIGLLNVDKPMGLTSAAVVGRLRRSSGEKRVGHGGTLDPRATGVLPVFFGRSTVLAEHLSAQGKSYRGEMVLGWTSTTDDAEGHLTAAPLPAGITADVVAATLATFVGEHRQAPPAYSAVKIDGRRSYARARQGESPRPALRTVSLKDARLRDLSHEPGGLRAVVDVDCGPGFYVRALARDLGRALGGGGYLDALRRTRVGELCVDEAIGLDAAEALGGAVAEILASPLAAVGSLLEVQVRPEDEGRLAHGMDVEAPGAGSGRAFARGVGDRVLAVGEVVGGRFRPHRLVDLG
ncbi:MAG: tRNA pseudouridine(55) synthase TruB [Candidatus Dormibacteria bacterium]